MLCDQSAYNFWYIYGPLSTEPGVKTWAWDVTHTNKKNLAAEIAKMNTITILENGYYYCIISLETSIIHWMAFNQPTNFT